MHDSAEETQPRRNILAIPADVFFADASIKAEERFHAAGLAEQFFTTPFSSVTTLADPKRLGGFSIGDLGFSIAD